MTPYGRLGRADRQSEARMNATARTKATGEPKEIR